MISELLKSIEKDYPPVVQSDAFRELKRWFNRDGGKQLGTDHYDGVTFHVRDYYGLTKDEMFSQNRRRTSTIPRQIAMYLMAEQSGKKPKWSDIGRYWGKNHATVIHAHKTIKGFLTYDAEIIKTVEIVKQRIKSEQLC
jgi:chromosomal replication initiation ATPase DnaA